MPLFIEVTVPSEHSCIYESEVSTLPVSVTFLLDLEIYRQTCECLLFSLFVFCLFFFFFFFFGFSIYYLNNKWIENLILSKNKSTKKKFVIGRSVVFSGYSGFLHQ